MKIADKAAKAVMKKNLEGKSSESTNCFAILNNTELMVRSSNMGVDFNCIELDHFDILTDLELARMCLQDKNKVDSKLVDVLENNDLPLEEVKFIEWKSDSSDHEGFQIVENKRSRKKIKKQRADKLLKPRDKKSHPLDDDIPPEEGISKTSSGYNLRRGATLKKKCIKRWVSFGIVEEWQRKACVPL